MKKILIHPISHPHTIDLYIGDHLFPSLKELCDRLKKRVIIIVDEALKDRYGSELAELLNGELLSIPSGEKAKTKRTQDGLIDELFKSGVGKDSVLIALGGGVTTDLVGFVASIYMRGVDLILIPTTLLAMIDASIGGKTAIDTPYGKNLIGSIYHPKAVFSDLAFLSTLPEKEMFNGLAEILKIGLILDPSMYGHTKKDIGVITKAIEAKIAVIEKDPTEKGLRRILNFGHTIGHGLEAVSQYEMAHGQAVAMGCVVEAHLSKELAYLSENEFEQIDKFYSQFPLHLPKSYSRELFFSALSHDKKKVQGDLRFVLIDRIGHAMEFDGNYCRSVSKKDLEASLNWMENNYG